MRKTAPLPRDVTVTSVTGQIKARHEVDVLREVLPDAQDLMNFANGRSPGRGDTDDAFRIIEGLDLVRGDKAMSQADSELVQDPKGVFWLQHALKCELTEGQYDVVFLDCPASLGHLSISLLLAATDVIVWLKPTRKELREAIALTQEIDNIHEAYDEFDVNTTVAAYRMNELKENESQGKFYLKIQDEAANLCMGREMLLPPIHSTVYVPEAYDAQEPIVIWAKQASIVETVNSILDALDFKEPA